MERHTAPRRLAMAIGGSALMVAMAAGAAFAADTVTQDVNGLSRTASIANLALTAVDYSHSDQTSSGTMVLTADDSSGTGLGWNVTVQSSAFVYSGSYAGSDIGAANFELTSAADPVSTAGQAVDGTNGPMVPTTARSGRSTRLGRPCRPTPATVWAPTPRIWACS